MSTIELLNRFGDGHPAIAARFFGDETDETPTIVSVEHRLGMTPKKAGNNFLADITKHKEMREFVTFYEEHNGFQLCRTLDSRYGEIRPMLEFKPAEEIREFTGRYLPGSELAWTIDLNKTSRLYRNTDSWIAFAEVDSGPACLTTFLEGENAGAIYYVTPQPEFNILRPIAPGFYTLLKRIADDIAAFLRLVRATVTLKGMDGQNYGLRPIEYFPDCKSE